MPIIKPGHSVLFAQIPDKLLDALDADAAKSFRNRTSHLIAILAERFPEALAASAPAPPKPRGRPRKDAS